jgi:hypothetical protein
MTNPTLLEQVIKEMTPMLGVRVKDVHPDSLVAQTAGDIITLVLQDLERRLPEGTDGSKTIDEPERDRYFGYGYNQALNEVKAIFAEVRKESRLT